MAEYLTRDNSPAVGTSLLVTTDATVLPVGTVQNAVSAGWLFPALRVIRSRTVLAGIPVTTNPDHVFRTFISFVLPLWVALLLRNPSTSYTMYDNLSNISYGVIFANLGVSTVYMSIKKFNSARLATMRSVCLAGGTKFISRGHVPAERMGVAVLPCCLKMEVPVPVRVAVPSLVALGECRSHRHWA